MLLQEVDSGARRTCYLDELALLRNALPKEMQNLAATYYWKSKFVPHPKILGPAGTKLVLFSRYRLGRARRFQLPCTSGNLIERDFNLKRAILEVELPLADGDFLTVLNTHLEAFPKGTQVMERQIQKVLERLNWSESSGTTHGFSGATSTCFHPVKSARLKPGSIERNHREPSEIGSIYERYPEFPPWQRPLGDQMDRCFTFTQRSGRGRIPVRTLDYLFAAPSVTIERYCVQQEGMMNVSDHLPLIAEFALPA